MHLRVTLEDRLAILVNFLLSRQHAVVQLYGVVCFVHFELPEEKLFRSVSVAKSGSTSKLTI